MNFCNCIENKQQRNNMKTLLISIIALILIGCDDGKVESIDHLIIIDNLEKGLRYPEMKWNRTVPWSSIEGSDSTYTEVVRVSCDSTKTLWYRRIKLLVRKGAWLHWNGTSVGISDVQSVVWHYTKDGMLYLNKYLNKYELDRDIIVKDIVLDSVTYEYNVDYQCTPISKSPIILRKQYGKSGKYLTVRLVGNPYQATDTLGIDTLLNNSLRVTRLFSGGKHKKSTFPHFLPNGKKDYRVTSKIMVHIDNPMGLSLRDIEYLIHRRKAIWTEAETYAVDGKKRTVSKECGESYPYLSSKGELWANPPRNCSSDYNVDLTWEWDGTNTSMATTAFD